MQKKKKTSKQQTRDHIINCKHLKEKEKCKKCVQKKTKLSKKGKRNEEKGKGLKMYNVDHLQRIDFNCLIKGLV